MANFERLLSRRIMGEDGWEFFCSQCGKYQPETSFFKKKGTKWGIDTRCKLHQLKYKEEKLNDPETEHLEIKLLKEDDFKMTKEFLLSIGYTFDTKKTVHQQFIEKFNLK